MINKLPSDYTSRWVATSELARLYKEKWVDAAPEERAELLVSILKSNEENLGEHGK